MSDEINNLKINVAVINEKLDSQSKKIDNVTFLLENHIKDEESRYKDIMDAKADKWTEKFIVGMVSFILLAVLSAIVYSVIKK